MIRLEVALGAGALACAAVAAVLPVRFELVDVALGDRPGAVDVGDDVTVQVHAPDVGFRLGRAMQRNDERVMLDLDPIAGAGSTIFVAFVQGEGPPSTRVVGRRDGRPIRQTTDVSGTAGVGWEVVDGVTVLVTSTDEQLPLSIAVIERLEVDRS